MDIEKIKAAIEYSRQSKIEALSVISETKIRIDDDVYLVCNYEEAHNELKKSIEDSLEEDGFGYFSDKDREYVINNFINIKWFDNIMLKHFEDKVDAMDLIEFNRILDEENIKKGENKTQKNLVNALCNKYKSSIEWYKKEYDEDEQDYLEDTILEKNLIDMDKLTEWHEEKLGRECLSRYHQEHYIDGYLVYDVE